jgi:hypothetical protein
LINNPKENLFSLGDIQIKSLGGYANESDYIIVQFKHKTLNQETYLFIGGSRDYKLPEDTSDGKLLEYYLVNEDKLSEISLKDNMLRFRFQMIDKSEPNEEDVTKAFYDRLAFDADMNITFNGTSKFDLADTNEFPDVIP